MSKKPTQVKDDDPGGGTGASETSPALDGTGRHQVLKLNSLPACTDLVGFFLSKEKSELQFSSWLLRATAEREDTTRS